LSDRQVRIYTGPAELREEPAILTPAQRERQAAAVRQLAAQLGGATVLALPKAFEPGETPMSVGDSRVRPTLTVTKRVDGPADRKMYRPEGQLFVATPAVLRFLGIEPKTIRPGTDFLVNRNVNTDQLVIPSLKTRHEVAVTNVQRIDTGRHLFGSAFGSVKPP